MTTTMKCPICREHTLRFEQIHGMRIKKPDEVLGMAYSVDCPKCGLYKMPAPKDN